MTSERAEAAEGREAAFAALPMYELPGLENLHDAWWAGLARHLRQAGIEQTPATLRRLGDRPGVPADVDALWRDPALLLSQTCGYPLINALGNAVRVVATPRYAAPGCHGASYCSLVLVNEKNPAREIAELKGGVAAINGWFSQSGMSALRATLAPIAGKRPAPFFRSVVVSGGHLDSLRYVVEANADVCAIDCVTHELIARDMPQRLEGTRVLCRTPSAPALPYITSAANAESLPALRSALSAATADPALAEVREKLLIEGFDVLPENAYDRIRELEESAATQGYPELR